MEALGSNHQQHLAINNGRGLGKPASTCMRRAVHFGLSCQYRNIDVPPDLQVCWRPDGPARAWCLMYFIANFVADERCRGVGYPVGNAMHTLYPYSLREANGSTWHAIAN